MDPSRFRASHEEAWVNWLQDDPMPPLATGLDYAAAEPSSFEPEATVAVQAMPKIVQIDIKLPKIKLKNPVANLRAPTLPYKKLAVSTAALATVAVVAFGGYNLFLARSGPVQSAGKAAKNSTAAKAAEPLQAPTFSPLAPKDRARLGQVGTPKTAYDGTRNSFSFVDTYLGTELTVSEQPIPKSFGSAADAAAKAAQSLHAKEVIATNSGAAFMATDAKSNSQVIVYAAHDVMVFIQSPFKKDAVNWKYYLDSLQ